MIEGDDSLVVVYITGCSRLFALKLELLVADLVCELDETFGVRVWIIFKILEIKVDKWSSFCVVLIGANAGNIEV